MNGSKGESRIQLVNPDQATSAIKRIFAEIHTKFALMPNLFRVLANAPAALQGHTGLCSALAAGALDKRHASNSPWRLLRATFARTA
jgi:hypothetical protein